MPAQPAAHLPQTQCLLGCRQRLPTAAAAIVASQPRQMRQRQVSRGLQRGGQAHQLAGSHLQAAQQLAEEVCGEAVGLGKQANLLQGERACACVRERTEEGGVCGPPPSK